MYDTHQILKAWYRKILYNLTNNGFILITHRNDNILDTFRLNKILTFSKFPDGCCWRVSSSDNKHHGGQSNHKPGDWDAETAHNTCFKTRRPRNASKEDPLPHQVLNTIYTALARIRRKIPNSFYGASISLIPTSTRQHGGKKCMATSLRNIDAKIWTHWIKHRIRGIKHHDQAEWIPEMQGWLILENQLVLFPIVIAPKRKIIS